MKTKSTIIAVAAVLLLGSCGIGGQDSLSGILGGMTNPQTIDNVIQSVLGLTKVTKQDIVGSWSYQQPGCAFTSEQLLAKAGGEIVAADIKTKLKPYYDKVGVRQGNTAVNFTADGKFNATVAGTPFSGTYTFDEATAKISMKSMFFTINCYAKKNSNGMAYLFEASKLITLMQTLSALSGSAELQGIGELAKQYDGLRVGFDMKK